MANSNKKWSQELRFTLYARLTCEFGPFSSWKKSDHPDGRKERFDEVLAELAAYFERQTGDSFEASAVKMQMKWAVTVQGEVKRHQVREYVLNKAAALDAGFIKSSELQAITHI